MVYIKKLEIYGFKSFGFKNAVLNLDRGLIAITGPNGSGKTTTLSLLLGLLNNQKGDIEIFGQQLHSNRIDILKRIGSLIEVPSLYGHLTAKENLEVFRTVYGASKDRVAEVLQIVGLEDTGKKTVKRFSLGMKQRLSIALALLPKPELLVLDEPTNNLDEESVEALLDILDALKRHATLLVVSHDPRILQRADRIVHVEGGTVVARSPANSPL